MDPEIKENLASSNTWGRALFMLLFGIIYSVSKVVLIAVVFLQFCFVLFTNSPNDRLLQLGAELSEFVYRIFLFLTYNSEEKPFPFADWPSASSDSLPDHAALEDSSDADVSAGNQAQGDK